MYAKPQTAAWSTDGTDRLVPVLLTSKVLFLDKIVKLGKTEGYAIASYCVIDPVFQIWLRPIGRAVITLVSTDLHKIPVQPAEDEAVWNLLQY